MMITFCVSKFGTDISFSFRKKIKAKKVLLVGCSSSLAHYIVKLWAKSTALLLHFYDFQRRGDISNTSIKIGPLCRHNNVNQFPQMTLALAKLEPLDYAAGNSQVCSSSHTVYVLLIFLSLFSSAEHFTSDPASQAERWPQAGARLFGRFSIHGNFSRLFRRFCYF